MAQRPPTPICSRCGYDLSGHAKFDTLCPIGVTCSECGYRSLWRDVLVERYRALPGFYEHVRPGRSSLPAALSTIGLALLILPFWRRVGVHHRVRPLPLLALVLGVVLGGRLALFAIDVAVETGQHHFEVLRAANTPPGSATPQPRQLWPGALQRAAELPIPNRHGWWPRETVSINPFLGRAVASVTDPARVRWAPLWFFFAWPATLLLIPFTLRRARVRSKLILRAGVFSLAPLALLFAAHAAHSLTELAQSAAWHYAPSLGSLARAGHTISVWAVLYAPFAYAVWLYLWWATAIRTGWRIRSGFVADALLALLVTLSWPVAYAALHT